MKLNINQSFLKFKNQFFVFFENHYSKIVAALGLGLNLYCIIYGIIHISILNLYLAIPNIYGILLLCSWTYNLIFIGLKGFESQKYIIRKWSERYLYLSMFAPLLMILGNFLVSCLYFQIGVVLSFILTYVSFFSLALGGFSLFGHMVMSFFKRHMNNIQNKPSAKYGKIRTFIFKAIMVFSGLYSLSVMTGSANYGAGTLASSSQASLAFFLTFAAIFIKLLKKRPYIKHYVLIIFIGSFTLGTSFLPIVSTHYTINYAEYQFTNAFGNDWREKVEPANSYFLQQHYSLTEYFLGSLPKDCITKTNILYYNGEGIRLYFDAYMPKGGSLPGNNSVLITIHGGGWTGADKGFTNKVQMNKYFAAQGYVVFDIQYSLKETNTPDLLAPYYVKGNFTLDDMVRHIGIFTNYLANYSSQYGANLDSVFITGGSAGGNLASAVGLGYVNTTFSSLFDQRLKIKGLILYYPANNIAKSVLEIEGSPEINDPERLITQNSPPCIIFHGTSDGIVNPIGSRSMQNQYKLNNNPMCALIQLLYGGHVSDYYFTGIYNQICLYYMERFLYLFH